MFRLRASPRSIEGSFAAWRARKPAIKNDSGKSIFKRASAVGDDSNKHMGLVQSIFVLSFVLSMLYAFDLLNEETLGLIKPSMDGLALPSVLSGFQTGLSRPAQPPAPKRPFIYIIPIPHKYNLDLLAACSHMHDYGAAKMDFCASVQNDGLGPPFRPFGFQEPRNVWFKTDSNMLEARHAAAAQPRSRCASTTVRPRGSPAATLSTTQAPPSDPRTHCSDGESSTLRHSPAAPR